MLTIQSATRPTRPHRGSLRVQGWLYTVLWPLHEALLRVVRHLERGDSTWRHGVARLEGIRDVHGFLSPAGRVNLTDLLTHDGAELLPALDRYAAAVAHLTSAASDAQGVFERLLREALAKHRRGRTDEAAVAMLAERLVDDTLYDEPEAPLLDVLRHDLPHLREARPPLLEAALRDAAQATMALIADVNALRTFLCDTYDLPPAPVITRNGH